MKDMQALPPNLRSVHIYIKHKECAESNEKSYFRFFQFLVFELLAAKELPIRLQTKILFKSGQIYREDSDWSDWFIA